MTHAKIAELHTASVPAECYLSVRGDHASSRECLSGAAVACASVSRVPAVTAPRMLALVIDERAAAVHFWDAAS